MLKINISLKRKFFFSFFLSSIIFFLRGGGGRIGERRCGIFVLRFLLVPLLLF